MERPHGFLFVMIFIFSKQVLSLNSSDGLLASLPRASASHDFSNAAPSSPERPSLPTQFHVIVEWNDLSKNKTVLLEEWYDEHEQKGTVTSMSDGIQFFKIMDFKTKELFEIADHLCVTVNMSKSDDGSIFGKGDTMMTPSGVLRFGGSMNESYVGRAEARGIPCHLWVFSGPIPEMMIKEVNILWYFADPDQWMPATGRSSIPIVAQWYGVKVNHIGTEEQFTHVYEYVKWEPNLSGDPRVFQTPPGVFCPKRKNTKAMPKLAPQFAITIEDVKAELMLKRTTRFWYDQKRLLARYDHMPTLAFDDFDDVEDFAGRPLREIHDFHTGLAYTIDALRGNCSIRTLTNSIDVRPPFDGDDSATAIMKEPMEIFHHEDSEFHYVGRRIVRDTEVDVWIGKPRIPSDPDGPPLPPEISDVVYEWFVLTKPWRAVEGVSVESDVPMQMITYKQNFPVQVWNFNDFDSEKLSVLHFDIQSCFRIFPERKHFQFSIAGGDGTLVGQIDDNINAFKEALIETIGAVTEVRPIRISNIVVDDDDEFVYVLFSMTEAPLPGTGGIGSIGYPDIPLAEATTKLEQAIKGEKFQLRLILNEDETNTIFITPIKDSLVETYRPGKKATTTALPLSSTIETTARDVTTQATKTTTTTTTTSRPTPSPESLKSGVVVSIPLLLVLLVLVPVVTAGCTVSVIFMVMRRLSALPQ